MSYICYFFVNNRSGFSEQPKIAIKILKNICNRKIDEAIKKFMEI